MCIYILQFFLHSIEFLGTMTGHSIEGFPGMMKIDVESSVVTVKLDSVFHVDFNNK